MLLKDKIYSTKMSKGESVTSYLSKLIQVKDYLVVIGERISEDELVCIALNGFSKHSEVFFKFLVSRD